MLSKEVFKKGMDKLMVLYPTWKLDIEDSDTAKTWYDTFNDVDRMEDKEFNTMIDEYIKKERYVPSMAGLLEHFKPAPKPKEKPTMIIYDSYEEMVEAMDKKMKAKETQC